jgi:glycosyltransferase involved in cell wall biosynthesis
MTQIAYVLKMYPRFSETFIVNEILELERQGVDVRIYSLRKPDDGRFHASLARVKAGVVYVPQYPQMEPARVQRAHERVYQAYPDRYRALRAEVEARQDEFLLKRFIQAGVIAAHLIEHPVDAMHAHFASSATRVAGYVHRLIGLPYSFTAHAKDIFHEEVNPDSLRAKMRDARFVVTVSDFNRTYLQGLLAGGSGDVRRLYNGIDLRTFAPDPMVRREPGLILSVGRLVEKKGFEDLIRACAWLREGDVSFRCEIVGTGERRDALQALIDELGLDEHVRLAGPKSQDEVLHAYRRATVFALPCIVAQDGNRDGLPTVLLEAMAAGVPVLSTRLVGVPEIVEHGVDGLLVEPGDPAALAASLARLLSDAELRDRLSNAGRRKVSQRFDVRRNVALLKTWFDEHDVWSVARGARLDDEVVHRPGTPFSLSLSATPTLSEMLPVL